MAAVIVKIPEGKYENPDAVENVIYYVLRLNNMNLVGGYGIIPASVEDIVNQFYIVKKAYRVTDGKQIFHVIFSIDKTWHFSDKQVMNLAYQLGRYFANDRQVVFGIHNDTKCLHIHMAVNTVAYTNGVYQAYWEIDELKKYANECVRAMADEVWFKKKH